MNRLDNIISGNGPITVNVFPGKLPWVFVGPRDPKDRLALFVKLLNHKASRFGHTLLSVDEPIA